LLAVGFHENSVCGLVKKVICPGVFQIFVTIIIEFIGFSTSASVRPHKKAVKKNEAEGAKEKQQLPKLGSAIGL
jgi:hypothetical protein